MVSAVVAVVVGFVVVKENPVDIDDGAAVVASPALLVAVPKLKPTALGAAEDSGAVAAFVEPKLKPALLVLVLVVRVDAPKLNPPAVGAAVVVELFVPALAEGPKLNIPVVGADAAEAGTEGVAVVPKEKPPVDAAGIAEGAAPNENPVVVAGVVVVVPKVSPVVDVGFVISLEAAAVVVPNEKGAAGAVLAVEPKLNPLDPAAKGPAALLPLLVEEPKENPDPPAAAALLLVLLLVVLALVADVVVEPKLNDIRII